MHAFRVPFPNDPEARHAMLGRLRELVGRFGALDGTTEAGTFRGSTPIGRFAGSYRSLDGSDEIEIVVHEKPFLVSSGRIESEARRILTT